MKTALAVASVAIMLAAPMALAGDQNQHWSIPSPGRKVNVNLRTGGGLSISAWDRSEVVVDIDWKDEPCEELKVDVSKTDLGVYIESDYPDGYRNGVHHCSFGLIIRVPKQSDVRINSAGGSVAISGVKGDVTGWTGGGQIQLSDLHGRVDLKTGGGQIQVRDSELEGHVATGGGQVRFNNVSGGLTGHSGSMRRSVRARQFSI